VSDGSGLSIQAHIGSGMACRRGGVDGASWHPRKLETETSRGRGRETERRIGWAASATRGSKRSQPRVYPAVTKGVLDPTVTKATPNRTGG
jgi:hypothetical protein